ncbi:hypothetical protein ACFWBH_30395 [Streptomyces sp. NPDC059999]
MKEGEEQDLRELLTSLEQADTSPSSRPDRRLRTRGRLIPAANWPAMTP